MSEPQEVQVGQIWVDRDKRMNGRQVRVLEVAPSTVKYRHRYAETGAHTSRLDRFTRAFRLLAEDARP